MKSSLFLVGLLVSGVALSSEFRSLSEDCEVALALSAAPENIQEHAGIYVLTNGGYKLVRKAENPFTCIVQRNHPDSLLPVCFDKAGTESIVQTILGTAELVLASGIDSEINAEINEDLENGIYAEPDKPSLSYMLSEYNWMYREKSNQLIQLPPHSMISASDATNESIMFDAAINRKHNALPVIRSMGPFNYYIVLAKTGTDSSEIEKSCGHSLDYLSELAK